MVKLLLGLKQPEASFQYLVEWLDYWVHEKFLEVAETFVGKPLDLGEIS